MVPLRAGDIAAMPFAGQAQVVCALASNVEVSEICFSRQLQPLTAHHAGKEAETHGKRAARALQTARCSPPTDTAASWAGPWLSYSPCFRKTFFGHPGKPAIPWSCSRKGKYCSCAYVRVFKCRCAIGKRERWKAPLPCFPLFSLGRGKGERAAPSQSFRPPFGIFRKLLRNVYNVINSLTSTLGTSSAR